MDDLANNPTVWNVISLEEVLTSNYFKAMCVLIPLLLAYFRGTSSSDDERFPPPKLSTTVHHKYGICEVQNKRAYMEDRHIEIGERNADERFSFYGIFDGHGGQNAAQFCVDKLCANIMGQAKFKTGDWAGALRAGFLDTDKEYLSLAHRLNQCDGSTVALCFVRDGTIFTAWAGDSRAVLVKRGMRAVELSHDHKPNRPDEKDRIRSLGGQVVFWGCWRVEGVLAVSRAVGDRLLKDYVTAEPEITETPISSDDKFLVLASDGVWDTLSNEDCARVVCKASCVGQAARKVVEEAMARGSSDNITCTVVDLQQEV